MVLLKLLRAKIRVRREFRARIKDRVLIINNRSHLKSKSLRLSSNISQRLLSHLRIKADTRTLIKYLTPKSSSRFLRRRKLQYVRSNKRRSTL